MKKLIALGIIISMIAASCTKVPLTGRKQFSLVPESQITQMSFASYKEVLNEAKVVNSGPQAQMVKTVGNDIATAVGTFLRQNKLANRVNDFKWEFNLIDEDVVNAWCMPGGKVAIYTGILPVAQDAKGLAVVMGHEVAHAVARHGNERMSQGLAQQMGAVALSVAMVNKPAQTQQMFMNAYGVGSQIGVMLPFSRKHESEADEMGIIFMAMAGYDPTEAPAFWSRMSSLSGGQAPPEFLSTHPAHSTRISNLRKYIPTAMKYYKGGKKGSSAVTSSGSKTNSGVKAGSTQPASNGSGTSGGGKRVAVPAKGGGK